MMSYLSMNVYFNSVQLRDVFQWFTHIGGVGEAAQLTGSLALVESSSIVNQPVMGVSIDSHGGSPK